MTIKRLIPVACLTAMLGFSVPATAQFGDAAKQAGKDCDMIVVPGDHLAMVAPSVEQAIAWFQKLAAK